VLEDMKLKEEKVNKMKIQVKSVIDENNSLRVEKEDLIKMNKEFEMRNEELILEI
jgi:regulator of replication initiation timing